MTGFTFIFYKNKYDLSRDNLNSVLTVAPPDKCSLGWFKITGFQTQNRLKTILDKHEGGL